MRSIGNSAFYNSGLTSVNFPSSLTTIEDAAFQSTQLTSVYIGANVTKLGTYGGHFIFASPNLAAITVDPANPNYASEDGVLYNKAKTQLIAYPLGSTTKHFVLPATLKGDLELALLWETRELESITIPASVNLINEWDAPDAVLGTEHLGKPITLNFEGSIPDTSKWEFLGVESMRTIVVKSVGGGQPGTSYLDAPAISLTTGNSIQAGSSCGVQWNAVNGATHYLYNILDVGNQIYSRVDGVSYGTATENLLWSTPGTYSIWVQAVDSSGNRSSRSNVVTLTVSSPDGDTSSQLNQDEVFIKQPSHSKACLLCASTIMLRRRAIVDGDENWGNITSDSVKKKALSDGNLLWTFQYASDFETMNVAHKSLTGTAQSKKDELIRLLQEHPEGIVIYDRGRPHGVLLTDYDGDIFYCGDSSNGAAKGRIPLTDSTMILSWSGGDLAAKQDQIIANIDDIWYVKRNAGNSLW